MLGQVGAEDGTELTSHALDRSAWTHQRRSDRAHGLPVTGFFSVDRSVRDANKRGLSIDRIYERGEILALLVRSFTTFFLRPSASDPAIRGVRYALFYPTNPIAGHSMLELACKLQAASGH